MSKIHEIIPKIMAEVGGIAKTRKNQQQNYAFRGIDDAYAAFQPLFSKHGVFVVPTVVDLKREERETKSGTLLIYTTLTVKHEFFADDASSFIAVTVGEAMDTGDKSSNKAMSAAMKYALLEVFCVPTADPKDTEDDSPEPLPKRPAGPTERFEELPPANDPQGTKTPPEPSKARQQAPAIEWPAGDVETEAVFDGWTVKAGNSKKSGKPYELYILAFTDGEDRKFEVTTFKGEPDKMEVLKGNLVAVKHKPDWQGKGRELIGMAPCDDVQM